MRRFGVPHSMRYVGTRLAVRASFFHLPVADVVVLHRDWFVRIARVISLLVVLVALGAFPSCSRTYSYSQLSKLTILEFTRTGVTRFGPESQSPSIYVVPNANSLVPEWVTNHLRYFGSGRVDLSKNLLIVVSRGVTDYDWNLIVVTDIWQRGKTILIRAQILNWPDNLAAPKSTVSPADVVIVGKDHIAGTGEFTFKLLNDYGVVIAKTNAFIEPVSVSTGEPRS